MGAQVKAIEYYFPQNEVTNEDLKIEFPSYDFAKFEDKVGINCRYVVENETALDLAVKACKKLFLRIEAQSIDYVLYCTQSPEYFLPTSACILQDRLSLSKKVGAFDFNLGCSGYTYGLSLAKALINSKQAKNVLLVTSETYSKYIHIKDRTNRSIFGDAATATLISFSEDELIGKFLFGTDGSGYDKLIVKNGCAAFPKSAQPIELNYGTDNIYTDNHLYMNGPEVFNFTNDVIPNFTDEVLKKNKMTVVDIDQFIFHQANKFMLNFLRKRIKVPSEKFYINLRNGGNTVSNTIPIALKEYSSSTDPHNQVIAVMGFGVGLSWCGGIVTIKNKL